MERLADVPVMSNESVTPQEAKILETFFGTGNQGGAVGIPGDTHDSKTTWKQTFRIALYSGVIFALLANPWINILLGRFPYITGNPIMIFVLKIFLFMLITMIVVKYVM